MKNARSTSRLKCMQFVTAMYIKFSSFVKLFQYLRYTYLFYLMRPADIKLYSTSYD